MRRFPTLLILALLPVTTVAQERLTLLHAGWLLAEPGSSPLTEQTVVIA